MIAYFEEMLSIVKDALLSMEEDKFEELIDDCTETLNSGNKIIASGLGKNVPICEKFVGTMLSVGLDSTFLHTNSAVHGDIGVVKDNDLVVVLTKSGETKESIYLVKELQKRDVKIWLLSFNKNSTLTKMIPNCLILNLRHESDKWNIVPNNSTTINLMVLQAIAMTITKKRNVTLEEFKRNHPGGNIGEKLK